MTEKPEAPLAPQDLEKLSTSELEERLWRIVTKPILQLPPAERPGAYARLHNNTRKAMQEIRLARIKGRK